MSALAQPAVSDLSLRRAEHHRQARDRLSESLRLAADVLFTTLATEHDQGADIRITMAVTYGDPTCTYTITSADFFGLDDQAPLTDAHRRALALAAVKAASPELFARVSYGLKVAEMLEQLQIAAEEGSALAAEKLKWLADMSELPIG